MLKLLKFKKRKLQKGDFCECCRKVFDGNDIGAYCFSCGKWLCKKCNILLFQDETMDSVDFCCPECVIKLAMSGSGNLIFKRKSK